MPTFLFRALRARRHRTAETEQLIAGGPGLDHLLDALREPGSEKELSGEQAMVAAMAAERRRATAAPPSPAPRARVPGRTVVVAVVAGLAVLSASGTAVGARTGNLPDGMQQQAHRLFSGLGVPAPVPSRSPVPARSSSPTSSPAASPSPVRPTPTPTPASAAQVEWCAAWQTAAGGGHPMNGRDRRDLIAAAGGEQKVAGYCASVSPSPTAAPSNKKKSKPVKSKKPKKESPVS
ncbi:hypothetical protein OHA21_09170 [Actinoplanes sp. NBC_00393]|uniref:hypothetical protein n=1 Tax=Actinoplanes sp. NBC_00393 TaxID=2975953 RepID=UPI002E23D47F